MNRNQKFTPKYWVFHNKLTDDIFKNTMSKNYRTCQSLAARLHPTEFNQYVEGEDAYQVTLIEVRVVDQND